MLFEGVAAHPWIPERRYGLARGIYNRLKRDERFPGKQVFAKVLSSHGANRSSCPFRQTGLNTLSSGGGFPAYQMVFGSNPVDFCWWGGKDRDLVFAQDTSFSGQSVQQ